MEMTEFILSNYELYFDGYDRGNSSLYLCVTPPSPEALVETVVTKLRNRALWSNTEMKTIPAHLKHSYAEELRFVACARFTEQSASFLLARFNHADFPSNNLRWSQWLATFSPQTQAGYSQ